jgi:uncharacterized protein (TIGR02217 family)
MAFHDELFPTAISRGSHGGPERRTDVVTLASGHEQRNSRWADSRRSYNAGYGVKSLDDLDAVVRFFEERRGRLHGFRWRDHADHKSCAPSAMPGPLDQTIGVGDGSTDTFQLSKTYGGAHAPYVRAITRPVGGTVSIAVAGVVKAPRAYMVDHATGRVTFLTGHIPAPGATVTAGFMFDVPVRFDTDRLEVSVSDLQHGAIPAISIVEIRA